MHTNIESSQKKTILRALSCRELYFFKDAFSLITLKTLNLHNKSPNTFALYIFGLKCCLHPYIHC